MLVTLKIKTNQLCLSLITKTLTNRINQGLYFPSLLSIKNTCTQLQKSLLPTFNQLLFSGTISNQKLVLKMMLLHVKKTMDKNFQIIISELLLSDFSINQYDISVMITCNMHVHILTRTWQTAV